MPASDEMDLWVKEVHKDIYGQLYKVEKTLFSGKSDFQKIHVVQTKGLGRMLINDGVIMLSEKEEFVYHEMISHIPLFTHPKPEKVLIIGGGDGGTAREVLRHPEVKRVVMIEIDEMVVSACREYIPATSSSLDDPRLEIRFEDGVKFAAETDETFDVALIDSTDPAGPAIPLFTSPFYESIANLLTEDGIMVAQAESPFFDYDYQTSLLNNQRPYFQKLHLYLFSTLTYPGGLWCFSYASGGLCPIKDFNPGRVESSGIKTRYYNSQIHCSAFVLPTFIAENYESVLDPVSLADMKR